MQHSIWQLPARPHLLFVREANVEDASLQAHVVHIVHLCPEEILLAVPRKTQTLLTEAKLDAAVFRLN